MWTEPLQVSDHFQGILSREKPGQVSRRRFFGNVSERVLSFESYRVGREANLVSTSSLIISRA